MLTEEDKYMRIQDYLTGRLSGNSLAEFESRMKQDITFLEEVEMHRIANDAVIDLYLLQVKDSVQKVLKQKANHDQWPKWGLGFAVLALIVPLLYIFYPKDKVEVTSVKSAERSPVSTKEVEIVKPAPEQESSPPTSSYHVEKRRREGSKMEKPLVETSKVLAEEEPISLPLVPTIVEQKPIVFEKEEKVVTSRKETSTSLASKPVLESPERKEKDDIPSKPKSVDVVFNPLIGEEAIIPMDETYSGELSIFDVDGRVVFRCVVQNGYPNRWDGRMSTGGSAVAGQYGYTMKDLTGKEIMQGFITVAR